MARQEYTRITDHGGQFDGDIDHTGAPLTDEEEEDDVCCAKCKNRPEDVLILTCDHNLCLNCAASNLAMQQKKHQNTF